MKSAKQFAKFCIVGVSNTAIYFVVYYFLLWIDLPYLWANTAGFVISVANGYFWNHRYVFEAGKTPKKAHVVKTYVAYGITFVMSSVLIWIEVEALGISAYLAPLVAAAITVLLNFFMNRYWVYR